MRYRASRRWLALLFPTLLAGSAVAWAEGAAPVVVLPCRSIVGPALTPPEMLASLPEAGPPAVEPPSPLVSSPLLLWDDPRTAPAERATVPPATSRPRALLPLYVSFAALQGMDVASTVRALNGGAVEGNPVVGGLAGNRAAMLAAKASASAATIYHRTNVEEEPRGGRGPDGGAQWRIRGHRRSQLFSRRTVRSVGGRAGQSEDGKVSRRTGRSVEGREVSRRRPWTDGDHRLCQTDRRPRLTRMID